MKGAYAGWMAWRPIIGLRVDFGLDFLLGGHLDSSL
jgi:hypothetical protein